jgi:hypothetical protein
VFLFIDIVIDNQVFRFDDVSATRVWDLHPERVSENLEVICNGERYLGGRRGELELLTQ